MSHTSLRLFALVLCSHAAQAETTPIVEFLQQADVQAILHPSGAVTRRGNHPFQHVVISTARSLQAAERIPELALALEHDQALRADARTFEFGVAVLLQTNDTPVPEQIDFIVNHLCDDAPWRPNVPSNAFRWLPPAERARMAKAMDEGMWRPILESNPFLMLPSGEHARIAAALLDCAAGAEYEKAARMIGAVSDLDQCSPETHAELRALVQKSPGRFDALYDRVAQVMPEPVEDLPAEDQPRGVKWGNAEWGVRMSAARALFNVTPDLPAELDWFDGLEGDSRWIAIGGMMEAIHERRNRRFPLREAPQAIQTRYLSTLAQAAGDQHLRVIWPCCLSMWINGIVQDPSWSPLVRAEAARAIGAIHASYPETADKAARYLQKAQELDPQ